MGHSAHTANPMTSPQDPTDARIMLSRRVLFGWKHNPPVKVEERLRMIGEELAIPLRPGSVGPELRCEGGSAYRGVGGYAEGAAELALELTSKGGSKPAPST